MNTPNRPDVGEALRIAGAKLANCAYNLAQDDRLPERFRRSLDEACREWDAALARLSPPAPGGDAVRIAGAKLSNCAFNLAQDDRLPEHVRASLDSVRREWDAAIAATPAPAVEREADWLAGASSNMPPEFSQWFAANYPGPDTIIHKPEWHAPKIWRAAIHALRRMGPTPTTPPAEAREPVGDAEETLRQVRIAHDLFKQGRITQSGFVTLVARELALAQPRDTPRDSGDASEAEPEGADDAADAALWRKHKDSFAVLQAMLEAASPLVLNKLKAQEATRQAQGGGEDGR